MFAVLSPIFRRDASAVPSSLDSADESSAVLTLENLAHNYIYASAASSAMTALLNTKCGAAYAIKLLASLHVHTQGPDAAADMADADESYMPLRNRSPLTSAQLGPTGPSTVFELAKSLIRPRKRR